MYCVHCGVRLQECARECPLCHTPVICTPMPRQSDRPLYSDRYPEPEKSHFRVLLLVFLTTVMAAAGLGCLIFCLRRENGVSWSGYVLLGLALCWVCVLLPCFFTRWRPMLFLPVDFACAAGYLLYICVKTGGNWFLSFAFPVTGIAAALTLAGVATMRYIRRGRLRLMGLLLIAIGLSFMLVEFFQHITFGTPMFGWSLYCVCGMCAIGLFLFVAGLVPPLRAAMKRWFFF